MNTDDDALARIEATHRRAERETEMYRLTKREQIAAMAMQGIMSNAYWSKRGASRPEDVSEAAVEYADGLLFALSAGRETVVPEMVHILSIVNGNIWHTEASENLKLAKDFELRLYADAALLSAGKE